MKEQKNTEKTSKNKIKGITLIALVVTIVVLLIISGVSINMLTGDNGVIIRATEAAFRTEMASIREQVDYRLIECQMRNKKITSIFKEKVTIEDAKKWDTELKVEVIYWGQYETGLTELTRKYVKKNWENILTKGDENTEYVDNLYYVDKKTAQEEHKYIYDSNVNIVYKVKPSKVGKYKVHSVEELDYQQKNGSDKRPTGGTEISCDSQIVSAGSSSSCYEPDLSGFIKEKTTIVYYNGTQEVEVGADQYLAKGSTSGRTTVVNNVTYEFYNYDAQKWANIKVKNSGIETWWVWIPRYAYKIDGTTTDIVFINLENKNAKTGADLEEGYIVHPAFDGGLKGIWVSKYEPSMVANTEVEEIPFYMPDMQGFDPQNTYIEIYNGEDGFTEKKLADIQDLTQFAKNNKWYDYHNKVWANIKVVNTQGTESKVDDIETWWVWIPRYAYSITGTNTSILFVDTADNPVTGESLPSNYVIHPAFDGGLRGIWVSKYEPSQKIGPRATTNNVNKPDMSGFDAENTYLEVYNGDGTFTDVKLSTIADLDAFIANNNWYDYSKQIWANIKVVNTQGTESTADDVETWWVWIPKYAYNITGIETSVIFLNADGTTKDGSTLPSNYVPHPAFNNGLDGIWASKFEPSEK